MHWDALWFMAALLAMVVCVCELVWIGLLHQRVQELEQELNAQRPGQSWDAELAGSQDDRVWR